MMHQQRSDNDELNVRIGKATDIGGNVTNQDDYYVVESEHFTAISVMDGHGENGEFIANRCKALMEQKFLENKENVLSDPVTFLRDCFVQLHEQVTLDLIEKMKLQGIEIFADSSGFLLQKRTNSGLCKPFITGGTTKTIVLLIKSTLKMYIANAGDSDALLCSRYPIVKQSDLKCESSESSESHEKSTKANMDTNITEQNSSTDILSKILILTKDHSATSQEEYIRMQSVKNPSNTKIKAVYDNTERSNKSRCPEIFSVFESGTLSINDPPSDNCYYKNVRREYATYITTPPSNNEDCALSVTRSICDNYLVYYGLTCRPEIQSIELSHLFDKLDLFDKLKSSNSSEFGQTICVLLATDGVWDNWEYNDINTLVMHEKCLDEVFNKQNGSQTAVNVLMEKNKLLAQHNFGADSDNATSILMYITRKKLHITI
jgi:serine/threonine protein phosphatase PrpC